MKPHNRKLSAWALFIVCSLARTQAAEAATASATVGVRLTLVSLHNMPAPAEFDSRDGKATLIIEPRSAQAPEAQSYTVQISADEKVVATVEPGSGSAGQTFTMGALPAGQTITITARYSAPTHE